MNISINTWTRGTPFRVWAHHTCIKVVSKYERQSHSTFCFKQTHKPHLSICTVNGPHKTHFFHRDLCSALIESNKVLCCRSQKIDLETLYSYFLPMLRSSWTEAYSSIPGHRNHVFDPASVFLSTHSWSLLFVCWVDKTRTVKPLRRFHSWILNFTSTQPASVVSINL